LFIKANDAHQLEGGELDKGLAIHNKLRKSRGQDQLPLSYYVGASPQRMWSATIAQLWVNGTKRGQDGHIIQDIRTEISTTDLL
jgi:hypothetical protein